MLALVAEGIMTNIRKCLIPLGWSSEAEREENYSHSQTWQGPWASGASVSSYPSLPEGRFLKVLWETGKEQVIGPSKQNPRVPAQSLLVRLHLVSSTLEQLFVWFTAQ